ncbi:MAG: response regulator [Candidatus Omnitrophota bacterium]|nr:response regulator [Candidatus Omnitrophota bacterium]
MDSREVIGKAIRWGMYRLKPTEKLNLLFVGEEQNYAVVRDHLTRLNSTLTLCAGESHVVPQLGKRIYHGCLVEVTFPDLSGLQIATAIREAGPKNLPIIALTEPLTMNFKERILAGGANECIVRPWDENAMRRALEYVLRFSDVNLRRRLHPRR